MSTQLSIPTLPPDDLRLPPKLEGLERLAYNLYWSWHPEVRELFARIDRQIWSGFRSPVAVLRASRDWSPEEVLAGVAPSHHYTPPKTKLAKKKLAKMAQAALTLNQ